MVLKSGHFGKHIRNTWEGLECGAGEGSRTAGPIVWEMKKYYTESRTGRNVLHTIKWRKANSIGHIWRRNCLLKHVLEGRIERRIQMAGRRGRRHEQLLDDLKETKGYRTLKKEALGRTVWRSSGRRQTTEWRKRSKTRKQRDSVTFLDFMFVAMFIPDIWRTKYIKNQVSGTGFRLLLQARVREYCRKSNSCRRYDGECPP
jgi:hypothetical protein